MGFFFFFFIFKERHRHPAVLCKGEDCATKSNKKIIIFLTMGTEEANCTACGLVARENRSEKKKIKPNASCGRGRVKVQHENNRKGGEFETQFEATLINWQTRLHCTV